MLRHVDDLFKTILPDDELGWVHKLGVCYYQDTRRSKAPFRVTYWRDGLRAVCEFEAHPGRGGTAEDLGWLRLFDQAGVQVINCDLRQPQASADRLGNRHSHKL